VRFEAAATAATGSTDAVATAKTSSNPTTPCCSSVVVVTACTSRNSLILTQHCAVCQVRCGTKAEHSSID
jgi:hypothetical protein